MKTKKQPELVPVWISPKIKDILKVKAAKKITTMKSLMERLILELK